MIDCDQHQVYRIFSSWNKILGKLPSENKQGQEKTFQHVGKGKKPITFKALLPNALKNDLGEELYQAFERIFLSSEKAFQKYPKELRANFSGIVETKGKILKGGLFCKETAWKIRLADRKERLYADEQEGRVVFSVMGKR